MAGHSKFKNIQHRKNAQDAKRAKLFTKLGKIITVAAKNGIKAEDNPSLRNALHAAKKANMPGDNIQKAINKAKEKECDFEVKYTGLGPEKTAFLVEAITDNTNRTFTELKTIFNKRGSGLTELNFMFEHLVHVYVPNSSIEEVLECLDNVDIIDINEHNDCEDEGNDTKSTGESSILIKAKFENTNQILSNLQPKFSDYTFKIVYEPNQLQDIQDREKFDAFIEELEELDDVQNVWHNANL
ncbi:MAG: YebC/PmpR family DNA-binding transcriptional regulator [Alphaproteobacteria bacterium]|nr:MAG: YebC/PmpR family DNA-binding transcriptional regulator [Alphaproteobacteria bacterium]